MKAHFQEKKSLLLSLKFMGTVLSRDVRRLIFHGFIFAFLALCTKFDILLSSVVPGES